MIEQKISFHGTRFLVNMAALVIILYGINQAQSVFVLLLFSAFLALIGTPPVLWLERKHVPSSLAAVIVMVCIMILLLIVGAVVGTSLGKFSDGFSFYQERLHEQVLAFQAFLAAKHIVVAENVLLEYLNPESVMSLTAELFAGMGLALSNIVLILLTTTFILLEISSFPIKLRSVLGNPNQVFPQFTKFINDIKRYMIIKTIVSLIAGIVIGLWLFILGVDFPVLFGFLAFLLHFVPNVGQVIAAIPAMLLALIQLGAGPAALVAVGYLIVGFALGNAVEPRLMGRKLGLSTMVVFLSLIFWGGLLGLVGIILCVPLTMTLKFAFENNKSTEWIAFLLESEKSNESTIPPSKSKSISPT